MKVPLNYKPADNNNGTTLLNSTKPYAYTPPKPFINIEQADYKTWCKADLWTVERAILLLLNAETLPSINSSYGICKSKGKQSIYDGFMKIWPIAESSLKIGVLKKIGKGYPSLLCEVLPGDFICWAKLKGYPIPDELKTIGTTTQTEAVGDIGIGNHAKTETKLLNQTDNEFKFSGLLNKPSGVDVWFEVIDIMTKDYYLQHNNSMPTKAQAWVKLCKEPPTGYEITNDKDNQSLTMIGLTKPFNKRSFDRRWKTYTAKSNHIEPN